MPEHPEPEQIKSKAPVPHPSTRQRQNYTLRLAFAAVAIVLLAAFFILPAINHAFPSIAGGQAELILFLGMIIIFFGIALWGYHHRRR